MHKNQCQISSYNYLQFKCVEMNDRYMIIMRSQNVGALLSTKHKLFKILINDQLFV